MITIMHEDKQVLKLVQAFKDAQVVNQVIHYNQTKELEFLITCGISTLC